MVETEIPGASEARAAEAKSLLQKIKEESTRLREVILTEEEQRESREIQENFDRHMQETVYATQGNLNSYRQDGWKQLIYEGENEDE